MNERPKNLRWPTNDEVFLISYITYRPCLRFLYDLKSWLKFLDGFCTWALSVFHWVNLDKEVLHKPKKPEPT